MINTKRLSLSHVGLAVDNSAMFYDIFYREKLTMALAHTLGFPRIGADRELKKPSNPTGRAIWIRTR